MRNIKIKKIFLLLIILSMSAIIIPHAFSKYKTVLQKELTLNIRQPEYDVMFYYKIPDEYQEIEFIKSDGTQWIDTGITINDVYTFYANGEKIDEATGAVIGGSTTASSTNHIYILHTEVNSDNNGILYNAKILNGNEIVANFIPCYKKSDGEIGLYDIARKSFFTNDGSGTFIKGNDVANDYHEAKKQHFVYGTSQNLLVNDYEETDLKFDRWNTKKNGNGKDYADNEIVNNLTSIDGGIINLYAQFLLGFKVENNPTEWTNQDVTLTVVPPESGIYQYSFDGGTTWQNDNNKEFTSNQDVHIKIKDENGKISDEVVVNINKIDKTPPSINFATNKLIVTLNESNPISSLITASDNESGIDDNGLKVYRYVIATGRRTDQITNTTYFDYPGLYAIDVEVSDKAGNTTSLNSQILVRWPTGGRYVVKKTELDGSDIAGEGLATSDKNDGLFKDTADTGLDTLLPFSSKYYYSGKNVDNYLSFADSTYRILNISTNDDIKVLGDVSDVKTAWGSRMIYESNTYNTWSTKWWPRGQIYNNETNESKYKLFTEEEKAHLDLATFYAGRFAKSEVTDIATTINYERTSARELGGESASFEGYSAYPNVSDYLKACKVHDTIDSIDDTQGLSLFGTSNRTIFENNSWIDMVNEQWTMNSKRATSTDNDFWVIDTDSGAHLESRTYYYNQQYRVVFYITDTTILSGDGSSLNPYTVQEDWSWFDSSQVLQ